MLLTMHDMRDRDALSHKTEEWHWQRDSEVILGRPFIVLLSD